MSGSSHVDVMLAGAAAAFTVDLLIYPLDTLKTRQQSRDFVRTFASDPTSSSARQLPSRALFRGLYQGIGIVIVATLPAAGTFFTTYEAAKGVLARRFGDQLPQPLQHSAASAAAECASCLVLTPAEVIKQNAQMLQVQRKNEGGRGAGAGAGAPRGGPSSSAAPSASTSLQALRQLSSGGTGGNGGVGAVGRRLLSGYSALVARNLPFTALQFPIFEYMRERVWKGRRQRQQQQQQQQRGGGRGERGGDDNGLLETGVVTGASAGLAGSFAALITTPMDVVKTRMMLMAGRDGGRGGGGGGDAVEDANNRTAGRSGAKGHNSSNSNSKSRGGGLAVAREVIAERGVRGLFRGALLRSVWTAVGSGLYLGMYEVAKVWLTRGREDTDDSLQ
ncbi:mitochondrial carrier domain-containing protein [Xylariaceae sp. FL0804]|nr:mitochondrial carrier domain-containing protein [Xylariaceae sp. FL0804]